MQLKYCLTHLEDPTESISIQLLGLLEMLTLII